MAQYICVGYGKTKTLTSLQQPFRVQKEISIILPTYNEEKNISAMVKEVRENFKDTNYEIVIVDDESKDATPKIIDDLAKEGNLIAVHRTGRRGYFEAFFDGAHIANGEHVITIDADLSFSPKDARSLLKQKDSADVVLASRYIPGGAMHAPFFRKYGSMFLNRVCAPLIGLNDLTDVTSDFHLLRRTDFINLEFKYPAKFGEFDFELLYRARQKGLKIVESPCTYHYRTEGESAMGRGLLQAPSLSKFAFAYIKMALKIRARG
jgi:dolichol-phosphate mannosyltransferase